MFVALSLHLQTRHVSQGIAEQVCFSTFFLAFGFSEMYNMFTLCSKFLLKVRHKVLQSYLLEQNVVFFAHWLELSVHKARFNFLFLPFLLEVSMLTLPEVTLQTQAHFNIKLKKWKKKQHWHERTMLFKPCS